MIVLSAQLKVKDPAMQRGLIMKLFAMNVTTPFTMERLPAMDTPEVENTWMHRDLTSWTQR